MASRLSIERLSPNCGSGFSGVQVGDLTDEELQQVKMEVANRCVGVFRDQFLGPEALLAFGKRLGEVLFPGRSPTIPSAPGVSRFENDFVANGPEQGTNVWHTDATQMPRPPSFTLLSCEEVPPLGGDTMWSNQYLAYETLSDTMKDMIRGRRLGFTQGGYARHALPGDPEETFHPLVRVHAQTGRKSLLINAEHKCSHIEGLTEAESKPLKAFLYQHSLRPEHICRHRWRAGDLALWDNRCAMHYAIKDYQPTDTRTMYRMMIMGEVPIADTDPCLADQGRQRAAEPA